MRGEGGKGQKAVGRWQWTDSRRQMAVDRQQKTGGSGQTAEDTWQAAEALVGRNFPASRLLLPVFRLSCFLLSAFCLFALTGRLSAAEQPSPELLAQGKRLFTLQCAGCHGIGGEETFRGDNTKTLPGIFIRRTDFQIGHRFRGFSATLISDQERESVVAYVKSLKGRKGYERPEMVISGGGLEPFVTDLGVRIVDLRSRDAYEVSHLPNAVHVDAVLLDPLPEPEAFARLMTTAGIGDESYVVAYDNDGGRSAALLWAALQEYGHTRVSVLDGGWPVWVGDGRYLTPWRPSKRAVVFTPRPRTRQVITEVPPTAKGVQIVSPDQPLARASIVTVPCDRNLLPDRAFQPAASLKVLYEQAGVSPDRPTVVTGRQRSDAAQLLFTLKLISYPDVRLFPVPLPEELSYRDR